MEPSLDPFFAFLSNFYGVYRPPKEYKLQRTCEANQVGENSSFIFIVCVKSVPHYHFKLAYVVLHMAATEFFKTHF